MPDTYARIEIVGYLAKEPELKVMPSGTVQCRLRVRVIRDLGWDQEKNEKRSTTDWFTVVLRDTSYELKASKASEELKKGEKVQVLGWPQTREYEATDVNGNSYKKTITEIKAKSVVSLTRQSKELEGGVDTLAKAKEVFGIETKKEVEDLQDVPF